VEFQIRLPLCFLCFLLLKKILSAARIGAFLQAMAPGVEHEFAGAFQGWFLFDARTELIVAMRGLIPQHPALEFVG
jgi:hypothetical protein